MLKTVNIWPIENIKSYNLAAGLTSLFDSTKMKTVKGKIKTKRMNESYQSYYDYQLSKARQSLVTWF